FGVNVAPQPLPSPYERRHGEALGTANACSVVGGHQAPLSFVFHPTVACRLAFLTPFPANTGALIVHTPNLGMFIQNTKAVLIAIVGGRQVHIKKGTLAMAVQAQACFNGYRKPRDNILLIKRFHTHPMVTVKPER